MSEELLTKKEWSKPEILDLDMDQTRSGSIPGLVENSTRFS